MHPAYSVILFTTASGAGYGLLVWLGLLAASGSVPPDRGLGMVGLGLAFGLIVAGLLASTAHLGRPERAWRAFSQWRSSWLSREGVVAMATFAPAGLFAIGWVVLGSLAGLWSAFGVLGAVLAIATVLCTGMIYQSLPTIRAWSQPLVTPIYLVLSLASGGALAVLVLRAFGLERAALVWLTIGLLALAGVLKLRYWDAIDEASPGPGMGRATGLGRFGEVRPLDPPHTQANYVMREMGYQVGRRHARLLRRAVLAAGFGLPPILLLLSLWSGPGVALALSLIAATGVAFGVVVERWLFFAEARHVVVSYYR